MYFVFVFGLRLVDGSEGQVVFIYEPVMSEAIEVDVFLKQQAELAKKVIVKRRDLNSLSDAEVMESKTAELVTLAAAGKC